MNRIEMKAPGKINLSLDVLHRRPDGYHEVKMIMQTVGLHDLVVLERIPAGIEIECGCPWVPNDEGNIAYKAAQLLINSYSIDSGIRIKIKKMIPVAAGMAGGSTDAAAVMKGMNKLFNLGLGMDELMKLGKNIGADVPFCMKGGTMLAEGIGEVLTELPSFSGVDIVLVKPKIGVSTAWVYKNLDIARIKERPDTQLLMEALEHKDKKLVSHNMKNVLEMVTTQKYDIIEEIKNRLVNLRALGSMMSGSGPTVFGVFEDRQSAEYAYNAIKSDRWETFLTTTISEEM